MGHHPGRFGVVWSFRRRCEVQFLAEYADMGVDQFISPDFTLGEHEQKLTALDQFITEVAGR